MTTINFRVILLLIILGGCSQSAALDSWTLKYRAHQIAVLSLSLLIMHTAAQNTTDTPVQLATNYFLYYSTWIGNANAFLDVIGWGLDWLAGLVFYKKGDTENVAFLKEEIKEHSKDQNLTQKDILLSSAKMLDIIINYIENNDANNTVAKKKLIMALDSAIEIIEKAESGINGITIVVDEQ